MRIGGAVVILMALVVPRRVPGSVAAHAAVPRWKPAAGLAGAPLLGAVFALGWAPCTGPDLRRDPRADRAARATAGRSPAVSVLAVGLLARPGPAVPPHRRRLLAGRPGRDAGCATTGAGSTSSAALLLVAVGLLHGHRRLGGLASRWVQTHLVGDFTDGAVMATQTPAAHAPAGPSRRLGAVGWARWAWRSADAHAHSAVPVAAAVDRRGAGLDLAAAQHRCRPGRGLPREPPDTGPWLDRLGFFDVYSSPWFSAIYLLLFVSLVGCIVPREPDALAYALRAKPPRAPRSLARLDRARRARRTPVTWTPRGRPPRKRCGAGDFGSAPTTTSR